MENMKMKLSDFDRVDELVGMRKNLCRALSETDNLLGEVNQDRVTQSPLQTGGSGGYVVLNGTQIDLGKCYVNVDILDCTREVLEAKLAKVEKELQSFGVEIEK